MITFVLTDFSSLVFILFTIGSHKDTTGRGLNLYPMSHLNPRIRALASHSFLRTSNIVIRQKYKALPCHAGSRCLISHHHVETPICKVE